MEIVIDWVIQNIGVSLQGVCYLIAALIFVFGLGASIWQQVSNNHATGRDLMTGVGLTAIFSGAMYLGGTFVPTLLG